MHLEVNLPALNQTQGSGTYQGWCNGVGNALLKTVELEIGGQRIDKHYAEWLDIWENSPPLPANVTATRAWSVTTIPKNLLNLTLTPLLNSTSLFNFGSTVTPVLLFVIALQYHEEVKVNIEFRAAAGLTVSDAAAAITTPRNSAGSTAAVTSANLWS